MAALGMERTEIGIKKTGSSTVVPNVPKAKLMYYLDCICSCLEADDNPGIRRLRNYKNYHSLSDEEEVLMMALCLALSPDKLIGTVLIPANKDDLGKQNQFLELSAVNTKLIVSQSLMVGGQQKKVQKIMLFTKSWIDNYYIEPFQAFERNHRRSIQSAPASSRRPQPTVRSPPPRSTSRQSSNSGSSCIIL